MRLGNEQVLSLQAGRAGQSAEDRARAASRALERAAEESPSALAEVDLRGEVAAVKVGRVTVIELGPEDVAAEGAVGLEALAQSQASKIDRALKAERRRVRVAEWVFDFSLLVFSGLVTFLLLGKLTEIEQRAGAWVSGRPDRVPALRLHGVEFVSGDAVAGALRVFLRLGRYLSQLAVAYAWLVFGLSLFATTRGAGFTLGKVVLGPAASLLSRIGGSLPVLLGALIAGGALWLALRALRLFFESVAEGKTHLGWLRADLATPVGELLRIALVVLAALFAAPVLTGSDQGPLAQLGTAALFAVALGAAPMMANMAAGLPRLLRRTYRAGDRAQVGRAAGIVRSVDLQEVELEGASGDRVLVPHLAALLAVTHLSRERGLEGLDLAVHPGEDQVRVRALLVEAGGAGTRAEMIRLDARAALYRVSGPGPGLAERVAAALQASSVRLGHAGEGPAAGGP